MSTNAYLANVRFESIAAGMGGKLPLAKAALQSRFGTLMNKT